jgi:hypothetical protein
MRYCFLPRRPLIYTLFCGGATATFDTCLEQLSDARDSIVRNVTPGLELRCGPGMKESGRLSMSGDGLQFVGAALPRPIALCGAGFGLMAVRASPRTDPKPVFSSTPGTLTLLRITAA